MPIITKPANCIICLSKTRRIEPEPTYAKSWHCLDCGKNWELGLDSKTVTSAGIGRYGPSLPS